MGIHELSKLLIGTGSNVPMPRRGASLMIRFEQIDGSFKELEIRPPEALAKLPQIQQKIARDLLSGGKQFKYLVRSGLQKDLRRADVVRALEWARWMSWLEGASAVKQYCKKVVLEETRNLVLLGQLDKMVNTDPMDIVATFALSPKKWELPEWRPVVFETYVRAYAAQLDNRNQPLDRDSAHAVLSTSDSLEELMNTLWRVRLANLGDEGEAELFRSAFSDRKLKTASAELLKRAWGTHHLVVHATQMVIEIETGHWSSKANRALSGLRSEKVDVKQLQYPTVIPDYVYDGHTRLGAARLVQGLTSVQPGRKPPEGIDLRWAGLIRGMAWRVYASDQLGEGYRDAPWEAARIPADIWRCAHLLDALDNENLYRRAGITDAPFAREGLVNKKRSMW